MGVPPRSGRAESLPEPGTTRVEITTDGVIVDCGDLTTLDRVATKTLELWLATRNAPHPDRGPEYLALGFGVTDQPNGRLPAELTLPDRLRDEDGPDDRRPR